MPKEKKEQMLVGEANYDQTLCLYSKYNNSVVDNMEKLIVRYKRNESTRLNRRETGIVIDDRSIIHDPSVVKDLQYYLHFMWSYENVENIPDGVRSTIVKRYISSYRSNFLNSSKKFIDSDEHTKKRKELLEARARQKAREKRKRKNKNHVNNDNISTNGEDVVNEDAVNEDAVNEDAVNEDVVNEDAVSEDAVNEDADSEDADSEDADSEDAYDSENADLVAAKAAVVEKFYETFDKNNEKQTLDLMPGYNFPAIDKDHENPPDEIFCQIILRKKFMNNPEDKNMYVMWNFKYGNIVYAIDRRKSLKEYCEQKGYIVPECVKDRKSNMFKPLVCFKLKCCAVVVTESYRGETKTKKTKTKKTKTKKTKTKKTKTKKTKTKKTKMNSIVVLKKKRKKKINAEPFPKM